MDSTQYRQQSLDTWNSLAPVWDERREQIAEPVVPIRDRMLELLSAQPGETLLDLACGSGELTELLSPVVGDSGRLICTDFAAQMVDVARRRGEEAGVANAEYRQMDAERMDLDDASVDGAVCRFGFMLMADRDAAFGETRRVLRDGGRLVFAVWAEPMRNPWVLVPGSVLIERGVMPPPDPEGPGIFALGDPEKIEASLSGAGLSADAIESVEIHHHAADRDEMWDRVTKTMGPLATAIAEQPPEEQAAIRAAMEERAEPFRHDDGYHLPGAAYVVLAKPAR
jgi:SAM-dependent methyltransferase